MSTHKIGIDCRLSGNTHAGIGRYIENLLLRLPLDSTTQWILFFHDSNQVPQDSTFQNAITDGKIVIVLAPIRHYSLAEQLQMPNIFAKQKLDLLHVPHFNVPFINQGNHRLIVTIHDLLWHEQKGVSVTTLAPWKYWLKYIGYKLVTNHALRQAETILVPSTTVQKTITRYYPNVTSKIKVTYEGADQHQQHQNKTSIKNRDLNTLLYVGSLYPHKNIQVVLQALQLNPALQLEIAGSRNIFQDQVKTQAKELGVEDQVTFLGFVVDNALLQKYQTSLALIQPSLSEGFGLTGLEAMSAGGAVLASDIPIFKEIYQDGATFFDPTNPSSLLEKITLLQNQTKDQAIALQQKAISIAGKYSWQRMTDQTVAAYLELLQN
jgi:glycosyltransferase involved in cell wall biosynthesis